MPRVATILVPFKVCDIRGCGQRWEENSGNGSLEVIFGVDPRIRDARLGDVILEQNKFHFCPDHAEYVKDIFVPAVVNAVGRDDPKFDPNLGGWVTVLRYNGEEDQRIVRHQISYEALDVLYRYFRVTVLSTSAPPKQPKVLV